jgi:hypothetical protein
LTTNEEVFGKASKYHHIKDIKSIKEALTNEKLVSLIPRL